MSKRVKELMQQELGARYEGVTQCVVVSLHGLTGNENNELRGDLKNRQIGLNVVKNSLARRAFADMGCKPIAQLFDGPCAIAYGGDSVVDVAKILAEWSKKLDHLKIKGGFVDGQVLDAAGAIELSKLPTRQELQGQVAAAAMSPGRKLAGAIMGPAGRIAGCIESLVTKLEEQAA